MLQWFALCHVIHVSVPGIMDAAIAGKSLARAAFMDHVDPTGLSIQARRVSIRHPRAGAALVHHAGKT